MESQTLDRIKHVITNKTGLYIWSRDTEKLAILIANRVKSLKVNDAQSYYDILSGFSPISLLEWKYLNTQLTTSETFFFRDKGQFSLLERRILPELIEKNKSARSLKIWSAGCSSGEEAYSVSILLHELIPNIHEWNIQIFGTDINEEILEKARLAEYGAWSFRMVDPVVKDRYFLPRGSNWSVLDKYKKIITFLPGNLKTDNYPDYNNGIFNADLIICRNVFIYFDHETISQVIKKFQNTLTTNGYLLTGHTELYGHDLGQLQTFSFQESVIYQKIAEGIAPVKKEITKPVIPFTKPETFKATPPPASKIPPKIDLSINKISHLPKQANQAQPPVLSQQVVSTPLEEAKIKFSNGAYRDVIRLVKEILQSDPNHFEAVYLIAEAYANSGDHATAKQYCEKALTIDKFAIQPYYLLSKIIEELGNLQQAKDYLKKIIYLSPNYIAAYVELGSLYTHENDKPRAKKMHETALNLLQRLPADSLVEPFDNIKVSDLIEFLKVTLSLN